MKQCQYCNANFANEDAYQIHLGIGAPAFHSCNNAEEMIAKGMQFKDGSWSIDPSLIVHQDKEHRLERWARLKSELANQQDWQ